MPFRGRLSDLPPEICPLCGAEVPEEAQACPECGSDEKTGWSASALEGGDEAVEEDDFDYERYLEREFGNERRPPGMARGWWLLAVFTVLVLILVWVIPWS